MTTERFPGSVAPHHLGPQRTLDCGRGVEMTLQEYQWTPDSAMVLMFRITHDGNFIYQARSAQMVDMTDEQRAAWALEQVDDFYAHGGDE